MLTPLDLQVEIIERCLEIHNKLVPMEMRPLHNNLVKCKEAIELDVLIVVTLLIHFSKSSERISKRKSNASIPNVACHKLPTERSATQKF
jgi:hypothetical protein